MPKNLSEAIDCFMCADLSESDFSVLINTPKEKLHKYYGDFTPTAITMCDLNENITLRKNLGSGRILTVDQTAILVVEALWDYFHGGFPEKD